MGRLPEAYEGRKITARIPFVMEGRADAAGGDQGITFPSGSFINDDPRPFEIHRLVPRVFSVDTNSDMLLDLGNTGLAGVAVNLHDFSQNQDLLKQATMLIALVKGNAERTWEWAEPYTIEKDEGFSSSFNVADFFAVTADNLVRVVLTFEGFLLNFDSAGA